MPSLDGKSNAHLESEIVYSDSMKARTPACRKARPPSAFFTVLSLPGVFVLIGCGSASTGQGVGTRILPGRYLGTTQVISSIKTAIDIKPDGRLEIVMDAPNDNQTLHGVVQPDGSFAASPTTDKNTSFKGTIARLQSGSLEATIYDRIQSGKASDQDVSFLLEAQPTK